MATSNTYDSTPMITSKIIEHAVRRCKVNPNSLTPEGLRTARESLKTVLLGLASVGINLWAVERVLIGLKSGQITYKLPVGTLDLLNITYSIVQSSSGTTLEGSQSYTVTLNSDTRIPRIGVLFSTISSSDTIHIEFFNDSSSWEELEVDTRTDWETGKYYWYEPTVTPSATEFRVRSETNPITVSNFVLANQVNDILMTPYNRDDYMGLPNKRTSGRPTNYLFEKLINPQVNLWPAPSVETDHLYVTIHRQVQEVGTLTQQLQIPARWQEAIIWNLAEALSWELPDVDIQLMGMIASKAQMAFNQAQVDESDGAPIRLMPNLGRYK